MYLFLKNTWSINSTSIVIMKLMHSNSIARQLLISETWVLTLYLKLKKCWICNYAKAHIRQNSYFYTIYEILVFYGPSVLHVIYKNHLFMFNDTRTRRWTKIPSLLKKINISFLITRQGELEEAPKTLSEEKTTERTLYIQMHKSLFWSPS